MDNLDLNKLRTFVAVVEAEGITAAARRLKLTRSAVSQAVSAFEASIGVRLFHRVGKRLVLTREGQQLHRSAAEHQRMVAATLEEIVNPEREVRGLIRIGLFLGFPRTTLAEFLARFLVRHPEVRFQIVYGSQQELRERLLANRIDLAFALRPDRELRGKLRAERLFEQELVLVAGRAHVRPHFSLDQLEQIPVVDYYRTDPLIDTWVRHHYGRRKLRPRVVAWAASTDLVLELVLAQVGVGVLPRSLAAPYLGRRRLSVITTGKRELIDVVWLHELADASSNHTLAVLRESMLSELARGASKG